MVSVNRSANNYILANLRQIDSEISQTQTRIGTGKKVNSSADNASVWATAQSIRSDQKAQDNLSSGIAVAKGRADTAVSALDTVMNLLGQIKVLADDTAANPPTDYGAVNNKITALKAQITKTIDSAGFEGSNFLKASPTGTAVATAVADGSTQTTSFTAIDVNTASTGIMTVFNAITSTLTSTASTSTTLSAGVDTAVTALSNYQATLSTFSSILTSTQDLQKAFTGIRDSALSSLLDADLTEESAKLTALQTQQQLAYQALSIGNSSAANILRLFQ